VLVCHRRFGKTVLAVNDLQKRVLTVKRSRPRAALIGPTYRQEKAAAWDYMQYYSKPIPGVGTNQSELRIDYPNGGQTRIYGADNPDALRGIYLDDVAMDEYGMHPPKAFSEVIGPALSDRGGKALFLGTPNGKNQFYDMAERAKAEMAAGNPDWWFGEFKASQTGYVAQKELDTARATMTEDEYAQEYECSFEAAVRGAIFSKELDASRQAGRVASVP
jgi:phage terminase large subunit